MFSLMLLPLNSIVSVPSWPSIVSLPSPGSHWKRVVAGAEQGGVVALVAVDEVVAVAAEQDVGAVAAEERVVARAAVDGDLRSASARFPVAEKLSSPPLALRTRFSEVPMSIENGAGLTRSNRTRVPLAVAVNCSAPLPPLTSTVSMPSPPSLRSVSSPGFQIIRSLPLWPKAWSSASPPVRVSLSPPPNRRSLPPLPSSVSLPAWPKSWSAPEPPVRTSLPAPPNRFAAGSAPLASLRRDHVVAAQAEDLDQRGVGDRRRAADDGDRAAVHQDPPRRVAADRDRVVGGCRRTRSAPRC